MSVSACIYKACIILNLIIWDHVAKTRVVNLLFLILRLVDSIFLLNIYIWLSIFLVWSYLCLNVCHIAYIVYSWQFLTYNPGCSQLSSFSLFISGSKHGQRKRQNCAHWSNFKLMHNDLLIWPLALPRKSNTFLSFFLYVPNLRLLFCLLSPKFFLVLPPSSCSLPVVVLFSVSLGK